MKTRESRPPTPPDVALQLRQESGFGCCRCGFPFVQYHHIFPWEKEHHFRPLDMMTLCPNCHAMATRGALPESEQRKHKASPRNIRRGFASGLLAVAQDYCAVTFGSVQFVGDGPFVVVNGESLFALRLGRQNQLELSIALHDKDDNLILLIENNEWVTGDPDPWDFEFKYDYVKLRRRKRDIALEIDAGQNPISVRADVWKNGQNIRLGPNEVAINGVAKGVGLQHLCLVGIRIEIDTTSTEVKLAPDTRFGSGVLVSESDVQRRLERGREAWLNLQDQAQAFANDRHRRAAESEIEAERIGSADAEQPSLFGPSE